MIKINEKLTVLHDDNSSFTDYTSSLAGFDRDTASLTFIALEDTLYVGFEKPINTFYLEFSTANTNSLTLDVQYYNGSAFTAAAGQHDDSKGFTRNGFVRWDRNQTNEAKTTVNSTEQYWYKLVLSGDTTAMVINGLNIVFSDDQDLKRELFEISKFLPTGQTTHILSHVSARDEIIQNLNIMGKKKTDSTSGWWENITAFDLLETSEVKLASTYLTLSKIFMSVYDDNDDFYSEKAEKYRKMGMNVLNNIRLKVDKDDDGLHDQSEDSNIFGRIVRL